MLSSNTKRIELIVFFISLITSLAQAMNGTLDDANLDVVATTAGPYIYSVEECRNWPFDFSGPVPMLNRWIRESYRKAWAPHGSDIERQGREAEFLESFWNNRTEKVQVNISLL